MIDSIIDQLRNEYPADKWMLRNIEFDDDVAIVTFDGIGNHDRSTIVVDSKGWREAVTSEVEKPTFEGDLRRILNTHNKDTETGTPDFLLAEYLIGCLKLFGGTVKVREPWITITPPAAS